MLTDVFHARLIHENLLISFDDRLHAEGKGCEGFGEYRHRTPTPRLEELHRALESLEFVTHYICPTNGVP